MSGLLARYMVGEAGFYEAKLVKIFGISKTEPF